MISNIKKCLNNCWMICLSEFEEIKDSKERGKTKELVITFFGQNRKIINFRDEIFLSKWKVLGSDSVWLCLNNQLLITAHTG